MKSRFVGSLKMLLAVAACMVLVGCGMVALYSNLEEQEVNEMMAILLARGIDCDKTAGSDGMWNVLVERARMPEAVDILNRYGYPKDKFERMGQVFTKSGLVSSPSEERIRFMYALSQEISETITQIDGVLTARVHLVLQENDPVTEVMVPSSASVFVKYRRGTGVSGLSSQIKKLVTNSIEGLEYEKVAVAFFPADLNAIGPYLEQTEEEEEAMDMRLMVVAVVGLLMLGGVGAVVMYVVKQGGAVARRKEEEGEGGGEEEE